MNPFPPCGGGWLAERDGWGVSAPAPTVSPAGRQAFKHHALTPHPSGFACHLPPQGGKEIE